MASPQSSIANGGDRKEPRGQVTFRFCAECSNMLYPKEDEATRTLKFTCRTCQYTEDAKSWCVYRNVINSAQGETAGVTQDVGSDPTVGSPLSCCRVLCLMCGLAISCTTCGEPSPSLGATADDDLDMEAVSALGFQLPVPLEASLSFHHVSGNSNIYNKNYANDYYSSSRMPALDDTPLSLDMFPKERYTNYDDDEDEDDGDGAGVDADVDMANSPTAESFPATLCARN
jgi:DNA-directed RNA polymerase II subunit RPB9